MAIYHLNVKPISRSSGRSATAAAAYRAAERIDDQRTGQIHDYTRKGGVESADIVLPDNAPTWASDRAQAGACSGSTRSADSMPPLRV